MYKRLTKAEKAELQQLLDRDNLLAVKSAKWSKSYADDWTIIDKLRHVDKTDESGMPIYRDRDWLACIDKVSQYDLLIELRQTCSGYWNRRRDEDIEGFIERYENQLCELIATLDTHDLSELMEYPGNRGGLCYLIEDFDKADMKWADVIAKLKKHRNSILLSIALRSVHEIDYILRELFFETSEIAEVELPDLNITDCI